MLATRRGPDSAGGVVDRLPVLLTLLAYQLLLLGIGLWAARRNRDGADFYLGGRGLGPWVASISASASSSSAWIITCH